MRAKPGGFPKQSRFGFFWLIASGWFLIAF